MIKTSNFATTRYNVLINTDTLNYKETELVKNWSYTLDKENITNTWAAHQCSYAIS